MGINKDRYGKLLGVEYTFSTMNNVNNELRMPLEKGHCAELTNVHVNSDSSVITRRGYTKVSEAVAHSAFSTSNSNKVYIVVGNIIYNYTATGMSPIKVLSNSERCVFIEVNDVILYSNGTDIGVIEDGIAVELEPSTDEFKTKLIAGQCLAYYNGRIYVGSGNTLYCSEPFSLDTMDERFCVVSIYDSRITMVRPVDGGIFIGTDSETYFLSGKDQQEGLFSQESIAPYGVIYGTDVFISDDSIGEDFAGDCAIWCSTRGVCSGHSDGKFSNRTLSYYTNISGDTGSGFLRYEDGEVHYIANPNVGNEAFNTSILSTIDVDSQEI